MININNFYNNMKTKQSNNSVATTDAVKIANQRALFNLEWENDTVFKKRELNYKTKAAFQKDLEAGKISKYTTVFIKDSKEIYKNGQYYGNSEGGGVSGNFTEYMSVNSEISTEIFSNLKPPFGKQTTFTPSEGLKNLLINNASKNISLITFNYEGENISFGANITGDSQDVVLTINMHTYPLLLGFESPISLIYIQLNVESNSIMILPFPMPYLISESTGNSFFCDDGQFKKIDSLTGFDEISLSQDIVSGDTNSGNFTEEEYNKILAASGKGFIIVNLNGAKFLSKVSKDTLHEGKIQLNLFIGEVLRYEGTVLLANNITIKDKSENYAFTSDKFITNIYNGLQNGHIKINTSSGTDKSEEIDLIVNGDGTKFLSDDGQYKTIETISSAVGKIDSNSDGTGEIFNNYEGEDLNISKGNSSHAEGKKTQANSNGSHAEGIETIAGDSSNPKNGKGAHAEGQVTTALGNGAHAEGYNTKALKDRSHAEGYGTKADNQQAHAEGYYTTATGINSHIEGKSTIQAPEDITEATDVDTIIEKWDKSTLVHDNKFSISHGQFSHGEGYDTLALGNYSHAEGSLNIAKGECSHAEGFFNEASGMNSHAEGDQNQASGVNAHAEGSKNVASNTNSHAEGQGTIASGKYSHAEGIKTQATGDGSHAEGDNCIALGINSHVEGNNSLSGGNNSHIEGGQEEFTQLSVTFSKQEDGNFYYVDKPINSAFKFGGILYNLLNIKSINSRLIIQTDKEIQTLDKEIQITLYKHYAGSKYSHVEGFESITYNELSTDYLEGDCIANHAEGYRTKSYGRFGSHSEGNTTVASGKSSHAEGSNTKASGPMSHAEGLSTKAIGSYSHAEGYSTKATYNQCHAEGHSSKASGQASHAEGMNTEANGQYSHAEGNASRADGMASHAEGNSSEAHGNSSHAEGNNVKSIGDCSHAEGSFTISSGRNSHAEGDQTESFGTSSHSEGEGTLASGNNSHAEGKSELYEENNITIFSVDTETKSIICSRTFESKIGCYISFSISSKIYRINKYEFISDEQRKITLDSVEGLSENDLCYYKLYSLVAKGDCSHAEGIDTISSGIASHSEGHNTDATGAYSHTEGEDTFSSGTYSHAEGKNTSATSDASHAEGWSSLASNICAHSEGYNTTSKGLYSHAEGNNSVASGDSSHAEGNDTKASGHHSHAEGNNTVASGENSHAEGYGSISSGVQSHAEGTSTRAKGDYSHSEGWNTIANGDYSHSEGHETTSIGAKSHAEGQLSKSIGDQSHAEGYQTLAIGNYAHAEGGGAIKVDEAFYTKTDSEIIAEWERLFQTPTEYEKGDGFSMAKGKGSHSEGKNTLALGDYSHAGGNASIARGKGSFSHGYIDDAVHDGSGCVLLGHIKANGDGSWAGGYSVDSEGGVSSNGRASFAFGCAYSGGSIIADGVGSVAIGVVNTGNMSSIALGSVALNCSTIANNYGQTSIGSYNSSDSAPSSNSLNVEKIAFAIGNGSGENNRGNAFKVLFNGQTYADGAYSGSGADYAEFFEWKDGNESNEDRVGLFVSIENDKIVKATKDSKYILGIVSGNPSVIGDNPMRWKNKYLTDKFGRPIYEEVEVKKYEKKINDNGEEEVVEIIEKQKIFKINPEWDSSKEYISRESRKEWSAIGLMGKLIVRHDGTLKQGGFCYPSENGIATNSETGYYVMKVYEDTALIMFK